MIRVKERLKIVLPLTLFIICFLLYLNTKSIVKTGIVLLAVPFSIIGAVWLLWFLDYNVSIAVWVGMIALMGLDAETGVFMLLFLDLAYQDAVKAGKMKTRFERCHHTRRRKTFTPKTNDSHSSFYGTSSDYVSSGSGSDMMKRVAAPMIGGLFTSFILELLVYPAIYALWKRREIKNIGTT